MDDLAITTYTDAYKEEIIDLILGIQQKEYAIPIQRADQPDLDDIPHFYQSGAGNFWLARHDGRVVGTVALIDIGEGRGVIRKMFVHAAYRGDSHGVARRLLAELLTWAGDRGITAVYLGTTDKFLAAHRFYAKNGFCEIDQADLPPAFPLMKVDSRFYCLRL